MSRGGAAGDREPPDRPALPPLYGSPHTTPGLGAMGMKILLVSLSVLFAASMIGYGVVRSRNPHWVAPGTPAMPPGLWGSTALLLASSATVEAALRGVRRGRYREFRTMILLTALLGAAFLAAQGMNWAAMVNRQLVPTVNLYAWTYYVLTGLHAAHVVGGLIPLSVVTRRAFRGAYTREHHPGVQYCAMYWHFLDAVWLVLFTVMFLL